MTKLTLFSMICTIGLSACNTPKDMSLYYDNHLNDTTHLSNPEIKIQKEAVFEQVVKFDKWYRDNYQKILRSSDDEFWSVNYYPDKEDTMRLRILREKVIPAIPKCLFITEKLKNKAMKNSQMKDPQNLGVMLSNCDYGKELRGLTFFQTTDEYEAFHSRAFLNSFKNRGDGDDTPIREISKEEALFYHLTMIKIKNQNKAFYRVHTSMSNGTMAMNKYGYLVLELAKTNNEWLIDDMYYITKDELIEDPRGIKGLIDYNNGYPGIEIP